MPYKAVVAENLQRDTLRKIITNPKSTPKQRELAQLRLSYSEDSKLLTGTVNKLVGVKRLYLRHLPTQTSGRWSTWITNWPRACINQECPRSEHEWTDECWSIRDILLPDSDEILITWDHDNIEGKIHDLIVNDEQAIEAHSEGYDLHTITCCNIFNYPLPPNLKNPHTFCECNIVQEDGTFPFDTFMEKGIPLSRCVHCEWRTTHNWQGKDTKQRVLAKNFNHGAKYTESYKFVHRISGVEQYGVDYKDLERLAKRYIASKGDAWERKLAIMASIRRERVARSLYGFRRIFFDSSAETGREGFSHMISGTVSDYNNETLKLLEGWLGNSMRLLHNAHDGDKIAVKSQAIIEWGNVNNSMDKFKSELKGVIERPITYQGRSLIMTAGIKIYT